MRRALDKREAESEYLDPTSDDLNSRSNSELIGGSEPMRCVFDAVRRVADSFSTVLIRGESGTEKGIVARAIVRTKRCGST